ncbi:uncharacterized protein LOC122007822 [Zingiber officinale]|uniref:uncharacterized protein LOC122007822 n=1 Tax=Zingiber officinale TaxID=94328 RepID=UPI001C4C454C|nr:uncharacterized protein LOC122007822 [Zingiber officinale]XP_042419282.1 uncharacterized protein LOC122007822 [Zingiber officinale]
MENTQNTESSYRKRSSCDPGDRSSPPKRGRVVCRTMGSSPVDDHEEPGLDLTLRLGSSRTTQNQRVQFQAPAVEDKISKLESVRAELARSEEKNWLLKEMLSVATKENDELRDRLSKLHFKGRNKQATEKKMRIAPGPSSSSNPDRAEPSMKKPQVSLRILTEKPIIKDDCLWKK